MNAEAVQQAAAPLAFIALRIHTALTAPCPRNIIFLSVVAVNVLISLFFVLSSFNPHISTTIVFVVVFSVLPPPLSVCLSVEAVF